MALESKSGSTKKDKASVTVDFEITSAQVHVHVNMTRTITLDKGKETEKVLSIDNVGEPIYLQLENWDQVANISSVNLEEMVAQARTKAEEKHSI